MLRPSLQVILRCSLSSEALCQQSMKPQKKEPLVSLQDISNVFDPYSPGSSLWWSTLIYAVESDLKLLLFIIFHSFPILIFWIHILNNKSLSKQTLC